MQATASGVDGVLLAAAVGDFEVCCERLRIRSAAVPPASGARERDAINGPAEADGGERSPAQLLERARQSALFATSLVVARAAKQGPAEASTDAHLLWARICVPALVEEALEALRPGGAFALSVEFLCARSRALVQCCAP